MREILFRAKAINRESIDGRCRRTDYKNGDWVYGLITKPYNEEYDFPAEMRNTDGVTGIEVDYKTIGQFTGLTDTNGVKLFEGDICKAMIYDNRVICKMGVVGEVRYEDGTFEFTCEYGDFYIFCVNDENFEIIGNVYDNPELLGEDDEQNG